MRKLKKKAVTGLIGATLAGALIAGGTMAYLTDAESAKNTIVVGDVQVDLVEKEWAKLTDADKNALVANEEVALDPSVYNTGNTDAVVFVSVKTPVQYVAVADLEGRSQYGYDADNKPAKATTELVVLKTSDIPAEDVGVAGINTGWTELENEGYYTDADGNVMTKEAVAAALEADPDSLDYSHVRIYGYTEKLAANAQTPTVFDKVQVANIIERPVVVDADAVIDCSAYAIQASNLWAKDGDASIDLASDLTIDNLIKIYKRFATQSGQVTVPDANINNDLDISGSEISTP